MSSIAQLKNRELRNLKNGALALAMAMAPFLTPSGRAQEAQASGKSVPILFFGDNFNPDADSSDLAAQEEKQIEFIHEKGAAGVKTFAIDLPSNFTDELKKALAIGTEQAEAHFIAEMAIDQVKNWEPAQYQNYLKAVAEFKAHPYKVDPETEQLCTDPEIHTEKVVAQVEMGTHEGSIAHRYKLALAAIQSGMNIQLVGSKYSDFSSSDEMLTPEGSDKIEEEMAEKIEKLPKDTNGVLVFARAGIEVGFKLLKLDPEAQPQVVAMQRSTPDGDATQKPGGVAPTR